jgi:hypothetical protein
VLLAIPAFGGATSFPGSDQKAALISLYQNNQPSELIQTTLTPTFFALPTLSSRLLDMASDVDRPRTQGILASSRWFKGTFLTEAEVAHNAGWKMAPSETSFGSSSNDVSNRMIRVAFMGTHGMFRYGLTYRTAGTAFLNMPDQLSREVWGEWNWGPTTIRSTVGQLSNNVEADPARSRLEQRYSRSVLSWAKASWPELSLTYTYGSLSSALDPIGIIPQHTRNNTIEGGLGFSGRSWTARLASAYVMTNDLFRGGAESTAVVQMFTATFRPLNTLTILPTFSYREESQLWSGIRTASPTALLSLHYRQSQRLLITATGNYTSSRSSDGLIDVENVSSKGVFAWELQRALTWSTHLAFEAGYSRVSNRITPAANIEDISGQLRFFVAML